jgi:hypothetical protein
MSHPIPLESQNQTTNLMDAKTMELEKSLQKQIALNKDLESKLHEQEYYFANAQQLETALAETLQRINGEHGDLSILYEDAKRWPNKDLVATARCQELVSRLEINRLKADLTQEILENMALVESLDGELCFREIAEMDALEAAQNINDMQRELANLRARLARSKKSQRLRMANRDLIKKQRRRDRQS